MENSEIAKILREIAFFLEMDAVPFKPRAYEQAAISIETLNEKVEDIYQKKGVKALMEISGIGHSIAEKLEELITTGTLKYYDDLKMRVPVDVDDLSRIEGVGPKTIKTLWQYLQIKSLDDLERAARTHQIRTLPGFKEKTEQNILKSIEFARKSRGRYILGFTLPLIRDIEDKLRELPEVKKVIVAGSARRMKETIGDVDFLVVSDHPTKVMAFFTSMAEAIDVMGKGDTKSSIKLKTGMDADLRVLPEESFGAALQYFTGSKAHNIALRRLAQEKKLKLSEYGLFRGLERIAGRSEEEIYKRLGLPWIPPELRENTGEIQAALNNCLPPLINYDDLRGDLQVHSNWTDGVNTIWEMAEEAQKQGLDYIVISDHSKSLSVAGGLDETMLLKQGEEIDQVNEEARIQVLKGVELNILKDGSLDIADEVLERLDFVGVAVHSHFNLSREAMTNRILKALSNPNVDLLCHPTTRQIHRREPILLDIERVIEAAKDNHVILDIDAYPDRLDLKDDYIRKAVEIKAKLGISSDSHNRFHLHFLELGVAQARRGWATANDVVNTRNAKDFFQLLKNKEGVELRST